MAIDNGGVLDQKVTNIGSILQVHGCRHCRIRGSCGKKNKIAPLCCVRSIVRYPTSRYRDSNYSCFPKCTMYFKVGFMPSAILK